MNLDSLIPAARTDEAFVLSVFRDLTDRQRYDSIADWILHVLDKAPDLAVHFELPQSKKLISAYATVLKSNSLITVPLLRLLTTRLSIYFSIVPELLRHPMASKELRESSAAIECILDLLRKYAPTPGDASRAAIAAALETYRLHYYQDEWNNTALRAVLAVFYRNLTVEDSDATSKLLEFVLGQLDEDVLHPGHIPEQRHAWWAIETLGNHADAAWLRQRKARRRLSPITRIL